MTQELELALRREILGSPDLFPFHCSEDGNWVQFLRLNEHDYRNASFLDQRLLSDSREHAATKKTGNVPWSLLYPWTLEMPVACDFIFHISHCGSTLVARMLGEHSNCFALREPWILRHLTQEPGDERILAFLALWSRTYRPEQRALIKATSFVSEIGVRLMTLASDARALLMHVPPETFLASVLDGSMSDIDAQLPSRCNRLSRTIPIQLESLAGLSPGERAALSYLAEMESLETIAATFPDRTLRLDFDAFLGAPKRHLEEIAQGFGLIGQVNAMLSEDLTKRYAKKTEVVYDATYRQRLIDQAQKNHGAEIERGLAWLKGKNGRNRFA
jgi:hypothetical protein